MCAWASPTRRVTVRRPRRARPVAAPFDPVRSSPMMRTSAMVRRSADDEVEDDEQGDRTGPDGGRDAGPSLERLESVQPGEAGDDPEVRVVEVAEDHRTGRAGHDCDERVEPGLHDDG